MHSYVHCFIVSGKVGLVFFSNIQTHGLLLNFTKRSIKFVVIVKINIYLLIKLCISNLNL